MCGISGLINLKGAPVERDVLNGMIRTLGYRGPDASAVVTDNDVGLAHARLSIIDIAGGHQPMTVEDGAVTITFNGEIFNYVELREELIRRGHHFLTQSDTEVVLRSYLEKGEECIHDFNGQWAFAIWDRRVRKMFLSRDRFGVRPLFYARTPDHFIFASEIKAILVCPGMDRQLDLKGLDQVFTFWVTLPGRTVFKGVFQLPPGHSLTLCDGKISIRQYWQPEFAEEEGSSDSVPQRAEELLALMEDATRVRLRSDVPVGVYLSGGIDSTFIAALAARLAKNRLRTFSVAFHDREFDESVYQAESSAYLGTEHQEIRCGRQDIGEIFPDVVWHIEQPVVRAAPAPMYALSKLVHQSGFKVVLTGEGSDEILGGYDIFKEAKVRRFWGRQQHSRLRPMLLRRLYPYLESMQRLPEAYLRSFFHVTDDDLANPFFSHLPRWELTSRIKLFYSDATKEELADHDPLAEIKQWMPQQYSAWPAFCQAQYLEIAHLLPGYILSAQGDRMAMAHSVEGRYPFLDHRVSNFAARLHPSLKMRVLKEKYLLKVSAKGLIPNAVLKRTKQPYRAPDGASFFGSKPLDYVDELLSAESVKKYGVFHNGAVTKLISKFKCGHKITARDDMALVGILSTQLLVHSFLSPN
jgi:asparagine synthase (glutamine-hydrolysing)